MSLKCESGTAPSDYPFQLCKRVLVTGRDYPLGLDWVRARAKAEMARNAHVQTEEDVKRAVAYGRFLHREMKAVIALKKYRAMRERYS